MSGIACIISQSKSIEDQLVKVNEIQSHRGPNHQSQLVIPSNMWSIGLANQNNQGALLSDPENPSIFYEDSGILIFDGVIYNSMEICKELQDNGIILKAQTDAEILLRSLHFYGVEDTLKKCNGVWAFIWFNKVDNKVYICRDRLGIKPLNYFINEHSFYFSSEIKGILEMSNKKFSLNEQKVGEYLAQSLLGTNDETFFKEIYRFPAGTYAVIDLNAEYSKIDFIKYWSIVIKEKQINSEEELTYEVQNIFNNIMKMQLNSNKSMGVMLSGGIDSSAITAKMHDILGEKGNLNILSAVSGDSRFDESTFIDIVASHLERPVTKMNLDFSPEEGLQLLDKVNWYNDEPVGSFSAVAHYLLMKRAKDLDISVIFSGQGADEILCGYRKYVGFYFQQLLRQRKMVKAILLISKFKKRGTVISQFSYREAKRYLPKVLKSKETNILGDRILNSYKPINIGLGDGTDLRKRQISDVAQYSVPQLAQYEDRMSSAWAREIRVPFLDYRLVEKLVSLPIKYKLNDGWTKYIFRKAIVDILPDEIVWRKDKQGFINPQSEWLKNELKHKVESAFNEDSLIVKYKLVNHKALNQKYQDFCNQSSDKGKIWFKDIFNPLSLESWLLQYRKYIE